MADIIYSEPFVINKQNNSFNPDLFSDTRTLRIQYEHTQKQCVGVAKEVRIERVIRIKSATVKIRILKTSLHEEYQARNFRTFIFMNSGLKCPMPGRPYMSLSQLK